MERDLFSADTTVHDLIDAKGKRGAKEIVRYVAREPGRNAPIDILGGRRGLRIVDAAASHMSDDTAPELIPQRHVYSGWCHAGLPHRKHDESPNWRLDTDYMTMLVESGSRVNAEGGETLVGVPFGAYARLILIDWQTEAIERSTRDIFIGPSLKASCKRMGLPHGGRVMELVREQMERIASCRYTFHIKGANGRGAITNVNIVDHVEYCDVRVSRSEKRFIERVRLSEIFYQALQAHPVSVDKASVIAIRNSSMAIDLYLWLSYRLHALKEEKELTWSALKAQFGTSFSEMRNFRPLFSENLQLALSVYRTANVVPTKTGITLKPSPPPVPQRGTLVETRAGPAIA